MQAIIGDFDTEETIKLTPQPWWTESMEFHINQLKEALLVEFCDYTRGLKRSLNHSPTRAELLSHLADRKWDQDGSSRIYKLVRENIDMFISMRKQDELTHYSEMKTICKNIHDGTFDPTNPRHVYIGRAAKFKGRWLQQSIFANPYKVKNHTPEEHSRVIAKFAETFMMDPWLKKQAKEMLQHKTLYCWCKPLPCHGDFLAAWVNDEPVEKLLPEVKA